MHSTTIFSTEQLQASKTNTLYSAIDAYNSRGGWKSKNQRTKPNATRVHTFLGISSVFTMSTTFGSSFLISGLIGSALTIVRGACAARAGARRVEDLIPIMLSIHCETELLDMKESEL